MLFYFATSCNHAPSQSGQTIDTFNYFVDQFSDIRVLRYKLPGFDRLSFGDKLYMYYLSEAALAGRDILWDQNFRYNLKIRKVLETIIGTFAGDRDTSEFNNFNIYAKRVFFANGIHHHYSGDKICPGFPKEYFEYLVKNSDTSKLPLSADESPDQIVTFLSPVLFEETLFARKVEQRDGIDMVAMSSVNFYSNVTQQEVEEFYKGKLDPEDPMPVSLGLNSRVVKYDGKILEEVYRSGGKYGSAIDKIVYWLGKAREIAGNEIQKRELGLLIEYYETGDLKKWDEFNIVWVGNNEPIVDYNNGFIETYDDPMGMKATWEAIVNYRDVEASKRSEIITSNSQWFEDHSPIPDRFKKNKVTGIAAKVINIAMLGGACYPASPLGVNLPNADWVRKDVGSKSVTLANITDAYDITARGNGFLEGSASGSDEIDRNRKYGSISDALHTDLHECIGHASGKLDEGTDPNALKNYSSPLEEARADLVALYFMMDPKIIDLGLLPDQEAAKAEYDSYLRNGLLTQIIRIKPGKDIEQAHMRCRALISRWVYERGEKSKAVEMTSVNGKTYIRINDYSKIRGLFADLLSEIQRIKSEGDYTAGKNLVENYGIKVNPELHAEVLDRYARLNLAPYTGFVNPVIIPVYDQNGSICDISMEYVDDYLSQMMNYGRDYSFLPVDN